MKQPVRHSDPQKYMSEKELNKRFQWLYPHLEEAGRRLRVRQRNENFRIGNKKDGSPVTEADREMSDFWMELITRAFPGEIVVSEEDTASHRYVPDSSVVWYIDPIDGTSKFIEGSSNYFVLIGMALGGKPLFGILYQPERQCALYGNPYLRTRLYTSLREYREIHQTSSWQSRRPLVVRGASPALRNQLEIYTHIPVKRSSTAAHNIISPLNAHYTGFLSFRKTAYWDLAAPTAIMEASGFLTGMLLQGEQARFNDGNVHCDRFYCLPPDTPDHVVEYLRSVNS